MQIIFFIMRNCLLVFFLLLSGMVWSQDTDTTIYVVAEEAPRFPACEKLDTTIEVIKECAQQTLLATIYRNVNYPLEARQNGNEGQVVVSFVIEKDSLLSTFKVLKDPGGGCGQAVVDVLMAMNEAQIKWIPGKNKGQAVRTQMTLPIKFKLQEAPPYVLVDGDSIYTEFDQPLEYEGGVNVLMDFITTNLKYPESAKDSCSIGNFDVQVLVSEKGVAKVFNLTDYNNLGFDFWSAVSDVVSGTFGQWKPAVYHERKVPATFDLSLTFLPEGDKCKTKVDQYNNAVELANEGSRLYNEGQKEEGLAKLSEALTIFPDDGNFLLMRGQAYLDSKMYPEACADLYKGREISSVTWFDTILPLICK